MTITNFNYEASYLPGLICNIVVKADLGRSTPPVLTSSGQDWQFHIATYIYWSTRAISQLPLTSTGQQWLFHIATDI